MWHFWLKISCTLTLISLGTAEWIEITQKPKESSQTLRSTVQSAVVKVQRHGPDLTTPSIEWLQYQHERFGVSNSHIKKFIVSGANNLKNSAQVVVPANVQVVNTKTKLTVKSTNMPATDVEVVVTPKVETTSRRDMTHTHNDEEEADQVAEVEQVEYEEATTEPALVSEDENEDNNQLQLPSVSGFIKFLKSMHSSWLKKSAYSIEKKIKMLQQLRDNLMRVIEQKFTSLWQPVERKRHKRGLLDESNLNFPPEAALMTINFLTFAVFLIKLVLQVVHVVKSKHYNFAGFTITKDELGTPQF